MIYLILFYKFLLVGLFSFGGGYTAIALIKESMQGFADIGDGLLSDLIAISEMTPGPVAINMATFFGTKTGGPIGALIATFAISLPAFIIIILYIKYLKKYENSSLIKSIYTTVRPACFAIILSVGIVLLIENMSLNEMGTIDGKAIMILIIIILADTIYAVRTKKNLPTIPLILFGGLFGFMVGTIK